MTPSNLVNRNQRIWRNPLLSPSEKLNKKKLNRELTLIVCLIIFIQIHTILWREHVQTNSMQEFSFLWPLLKSINSTWTKYGYSSILYAHLVPPTVNNFKCKINTGCLDCDEKEMAQKKLHHKQGGAYWYDLLFIFKISSSLQCCERRLLFFVTMGILHIQVWSSNVWDTVNKDTCNMYEDKTWINLSFHNAGCVKAFIGDTESGLLHWGLTYYVPV
jgi:hypothetical protein